uniref:Uncharacterized protein n=1 Tax=Neogoniolithon spectabile TaxID=231755 RepID=A0A3G3MGY3_9FLOR|nr:hypothetical protein [Neogoniolithon spectabile]AYR06090.1 hypothetical protein [Neogoniolithon spectabile]
MNSYIFRNRILGKWLIQDSFYCSSNTLKNNSKLNCRVEWFNIYSPKMLDVAKDYIIRHNKYEYFYAFTLQKTACGHTNNLKIYFLFHKFAKQGLLLRLNQKFTRPSESIFFYNDTTIIYEHNLHKQNKLIEKIYFLNRNVRLVKCFIPKSSGNSSTYFSSQIKIN